MTSHEATWAAIDQIAEDHGCSPSRLALLAGLDATSFNPSKRTGRWPSTETVDAVLRVTGRTWMDYGALVDRKRGR